MIGDALSHSITTMLSSVLVVERTITNKADGWMDGRMYTYHTIMNIYMYVCMYVWKLV